MESHEHCIDWFDSERRRYAWSSTNVRTDSRKHKQDNRICYSLQIGLVSTIPQRILKCPFNLHQLIVDDSKLDWTERRRRRSNCATSSRKDRLTQICPVPFVHVDWMHLPWFWTDRWQVVGMLGDRALRRHSYANYGSLTEIVWWCCQRLSRIQQIDECLMVAGRIERKQIDIC